jgi:hypothetical protein
MGRAVARQEYVVTDSSRTIRAGRSHLANTTSSSRMTSHHQPVVTPSDAQHLAGLTHNDIDLRTHRIHPSVPRVVVAGHAVESEAKTPSGVRTLALDPDTYQALVEYLMAWEEERYLLGHRRQLLFVWPNGNPLHPDTITVLFHKHCQAAGLLRILGE